VTLNVDGAQGSFPGATPGDERRAAIESTE
jgi:hypothetical protein